LQTIAIIAIGQASPDSHSLGPASAETLSIPIG
jgi:hypothetical protein